MSGGLARVSTTALQQLRDALCNGQLGAPLSRTGLVGLGIPQLDELLGVLGDHQKPALLAILDAVLAERNARDQSPELVWTGPEGSGATARDTAVVLRECFECARHTVVMAGYCFDHGQELLRPLHAVMKQHGVVAHLFLHVPQPTDMSQGVDAHLAQHLGGFLERQWPFGKPFPRLYCDARALKPGPPYSSLHAKCVVVDGWRAMVSSANFTLTGQERNIEVGVLLDDPAFASALAAQWLGLVESRLVVKYEPDR